jgi:hypothetical protein
MRFAMRVVVGAFLCAAVVLAETLPSLSLAKQCGPQCVALVLALLGREPATASSLNDELDVRADGTTSMLDIATALERRQVLRGVAESNACPEEVAIAEVVAGAEPGLSAHFVVIRPDSSGYVIVYSPPLAVGRLQWSELQPRLGRYLLLCGSPRRGTPFAAVLAGLLGILCVWKLRRRRRAAIVAVVALALSAGCDEARHAEQFDVSPGTALDLGLVPSGRAQFRFELTNLSNTSALCEQVQRSCGCAAVTFDTSRPMAPGESRVCEGEVVVGQNEDRQVFLTFVFAQGAPLTCVVRVRGGTVEGLETPDLQCGDVPVGGETLVRASLVLRPANSIVEPGGSVPQVTWYRQSGPLRVVRSGTSAMRLERGPVTLWADVAVTPSEEGIGEGHLRAVVGPVHVVHVVRWRAVRVATVDPDVIVLHRTDDGNWHGAITVRLAAADTAVLAARCAGMTARITPGSMTQVALEGRERDAPRVGRVLLTVGTPTKTSELTALVVRDVDAEEGAK